MIREEGEPFVIILEHGNGIQVTSIGLEIQTQFLIYERF